MLECQVSVQDFVAAIDSLTDVQLLKVRLFTVMIKKLLHVHVYLLVQAKRRNLYPVIIDSFEEYRYIHVHVNRLVMRI